jgi:hypothetical protein
MMSVEAIGIGGLWFLLVVLACLDLLFDFSPGQPSDHESEKETTRRLTGAWNHDQERKDTD